MSLKSSKSKGSLRASLSLAPGASLTLPSPKHRKSLPFANFQGISSSSSSSISSSSSSLRNGVPVLLRESSNDVIISNPLAALHMHSGEGHARDDSDESVSSTILPPPKAFKGYTDAELRLFESINIDQNSDDEGESEDGRSNAHPSPIEQEIALFRKLMLRSPASIDFEEAGLVSSKNPSHSREASSSSSSSSSPPSSSISSSFSSSSAASASPIPATAASGSSSATAAATASPDGSPSTSPAPARKHSLQAAARAVIASRKFVDALTADVEASRAANREKEQQVESIQTTVSSGSLRHSISKSKTMKTKQRQSLFGVASSFIAAYKAAKTTDDVVETIEESKRTIISSGSVASLIDSLTTPADLDMEYVLEFLVTHRFFTTSIKFLQHLINRYNEMSHSEEADRWKEFVQLRILKIIKIWMTRHPGDFGEDSILERTLKTFLKADIFPDSEKQQEETANIFNLIKIKNETRQPEPSAAPPLIRKLTGKSSNFFSVPEEFLDSSEELIAQQLTLIEVDLFRSIPEQELHHYIKKNEKPTPYLTKFLNWSHRLQNWMCRMIVNSHDPKMRVDLLKKFIKVAKKCQEIKNYNAVFEIVEALSLGPIQRLVKTWKALSNKNKAFWLELLDIVSPSDNYLLYRELLRTSQANELPSLSVYLHDLDFASDSMATNVAENRINFYKFHVIGGVLLSISYCQKYQGKYDFPVNEPIRDQLLNLPSFMLTDSFVQLAREREGPKGGFFEKHHQIEPMFGVELEEAVEKFGVFGDRNRGMIPLPIREICRALADKIKEPGIFRRPGNFTQINNMRELIDTTNSMDCLKGATVHDLAGLLKLFLTELPDPLFTGRFYKNFLNLTNLPKKEERIEAIRLLITMLPEAHRDTALFLLQFLKKVAASSAQNKMDSKNIAVVFSPSLFGNKKNTLENKLHHVTSEARQSITGATHIEKKFRQQAQAAVVLELMLEHYGEISKAHGAEQMIDYSRTDGKSVLSPDILF